MMKRAMLITRHSLILRAASTRWSGQTHFLTARATNKLAPMNAALARSFASSFPIASADQVKSALTDKRAVVLDVRSQEEILETGYFQTDRPWLHAQCTVEDVRFLSLAAEGLIKDKDAPVIVYCYSGRRASKAKEALDSQGYTNVLNAGGWADVSKLM